MAEYQRLLDALTGEISGIVLRYADGAFVPDDPANRDRQQYDEYVVAGGETDPPDPPPEPPPPEPVELPPVMPENPNDAAPKAYVDMEVAKALAEVLPRLAALEAR